MKEKTVEYVFKVNFELILIGYWAIIKNGQNRFAQKINFLK